VENFSARKPGVKCSGSKGDPPASSRKKRRLLEPPALPQAVALLLSPTPPMLADPEPMEVDVEPKKRAPRKKKQIRKAALKQMICRASARPASHEAAKKIEEYFLSMRRGPKAKKPKAKAKKPYSKTKVSTLFLFI